MTCPSSIGRFLIVGLLLSCRNQAMAYPPYECKTDSAKDDFKESSLIVIGKVTAIEKYRTPEPGFKRRFFWRQSV